MRKIPKQENLMIKVRVYIEETTQADTKKNVEEDDKRRDEESTY